MTRMDDPLYDCSISTFAWVGDAVFELYIRTKLAGDHQKTSGALHHLATKFVSAKGQAELMELLLNDGAFDLTTSERNLLQRARNFHTTSVSKHCDLVDYRKATAFEALIGWLWLQGKNERAIALIEYAMAELEEKKLQNGGQ